MVKTMKCKYMRGVQDTPKVSNIRKLKKCTKPHIPREPILSMKSKNKISPHYTFLCPYIEWSKNDLFRLFFFFFFF